MIARNVEARIVKLETRRQRPNEVLLIWRQPGQPVKEAVAKADFAPGERVMCIEWFGDDPIPAPRWHDEGLSKAIPHEHYEYVTRSLRRLAEGEPLRDPGFASLPVVPENRLVEVTDNQLLHCAFGVAT